MNRYLMFIGLLILLLFMLALFWVVGNKLISTVMFEVG